MIQSLDYTKHLLRIASFLLWPLAIALVASAGSVHAQTAESRSFTMIGGLDGAGGPDLVSASFRLEAESLGQSPITWTISQGSSSAAAQPVTGAGIAVSAKPVGHRGANRKVVIQPPALKKPASTPAFVPRPPTISEKAAENHAIISTSKPSPSPRIQARSATLPPTRVLRKAATSVTTITRTPPIQPQHVQAAENSRDLWSTAPEQSSLSLASLLARTPSGFLGGSDGTWPWVIFTLGAFAAGAGLPRLSAMAPLVQGFLGRTRPMRQRRRKGIRVKKLTTT